MTEENICGNRRTAGNQSLRECNWWVNPTGNSAYQGCYAAVELCLYMHLDHVLELLLYSCWLLTADEINFAANVSIFIVSCLTCPWLHILAASPAECRATSKNSQCHFFYARLSLYAIRALVRTCRKKCGHRQNVRSGLQFCG